MQRYTCNQGVQCWKQGELSPAWGKLRDVGNTGCYIETPVPFAAGTEVRLAMTLYGMTVRTAGIVRVCDAKDGMEVEFTSVRPEDRSKLNAVLGRLAKGASTG